jgi:hypothetical protein
VSYRNWLDALLAGRRVEAVLTLGEAAEEAWRMWEGTDTGATHDVPHAAVIHPTQLESSSQGSRVRLAEATRKMLGNWNTALQTLAPAIQHPDTPRPLVLYGDTWAPDDRLPVPQADLPAGLPAWMREEDGWAKRTGADVLAKRRNITITVPKRVVR